MGLSVTQSFDGVTAPALPSGYTFAAPFVTSSSQRVSLNNGLTLSAGTAATDYFGLYNTPDTVSNTWTVGCAVWMSANNCIAGVAFSGSSSNAGTNSMYYVRTRYNSISNLNRVGFYKSVAGTSTLINNLVLTVGYTASRWYNLSVSGSYSSPNTTINVTVQDTATGNYLDNTGTFVSGSTVCLTWTDGSSIAPGYFGFMEQSPTGGSDTFIDDFAVNSSLVVTTAKTPWHLFFESL